MFTTKGARLMAAVALLAWVAFGAALIGLSAPQHPRAGSSNCVPAYNGGAFWEMCDR